MQTGKPKKVKIDKVAIRKKIAKEFENGDFSKLDVLCPALDEWKWNWDSSHYKCNSSFDVLCLYVLTLEDKLNKLSSEHKEAKELIEKLIAETSQEDNLGIGDI